MTLAVALLAQNAGPVAKRICDHLRQSVPESVPLILIDAGSSDQTAGELAALTSRSHAQHVALTQPDCSADTACALVRQKTGCRYVLLLRPEDRLAPGSVAQLAEWLERHDPALAVLAGGWWLTEPQPGLSPLPFPDADRLAALPDQAPPETLLALTPDPRRLLVADGHAPQHDPFAAPDLAWAAWEEALSGGAALFPTPVLLRPFQTASAAPALAALRTRLQACPRGEVAALLDRHAPWISDALSLSPAEAALPVAAELAALRAALPRRLRRQANDLPDPFGALLHAPDSATRLSLLSLQATARQDRLMAQLLADHHQLRADLDLALPNPGYLADLYARVRAL
ncbi:MAG: hypothetical protein QNJ09_00820 [Paracoccaceae bacterium]|nr:hypothetical protein [Paracoccaceae bacterium]